MIFSWFDAKEAKEFGVGLANFFMERLPLDAGKRKQKSMSRKEEVLEKIFQQAVRFRMSHKLNIYKKAQLGNGFKWALKDAGYDPEFVDQLTKTLMLKL